MRKGKVPRKAVTERADSLDPEFHSVFGHFPPRCVPTAFFQSPTPLPLPRGVTPPDNKDQEQQGRGATFENLTPGSSAPF